MTAVTPRQLALLRAALGAGVFPKPFTMNWLPAEAGNDHPGELADLIDIGLMVKVNREGGSGFFYSATDEGKQVVRANFSKDKR